MCSRALTNNLIESVAPEREREKKTPSSLKNVKLAGEDMIQQNKSLGTRLVSYWAPEVITTGIFH